LHSVYAKGLPEWREEERNREEEVRKRNSRQRISDESMYMTQLYVVAEDSLLGCIHRPASALVARSSLDGGVMRNMVRIESRDFDGLHGTGFPTVFMVFMARKNRAKSTMKSMKGMGKKNNHVPSKRKELLAVLFFLRMGTLAGLDLLA
jgi:hypothetical protein